MSVVAADAAQHGRESWTLEYWRSHCEGYSAYSPDGHIGYVEQIVRPPERREPVALKVRRANGGGRGVVVVPIERVDEIFPSHERIVVADASSLLDECEGRIVMTNTKAQFRAKRGDWLVVHGHAVGQLERTGQIIEVLGEPGHEHYRVRWDEEHESLVYPSSDVSIRRKRH